MLTSGSALNSSTQRNVSGHVSSNAAAKTPSYGGATIVEKVRRSDVIFAFITGNNDVEMLRTIFY